MGSAYPSDWDQRRQAVYDRDEYTCQNCGRHGGTGGEAALHAHHIVPKSSGGTHNKSNLKTVCAACHRAIHGDSVAPSAREHPSTGGSPTINQQLYGAAPYIQLGYDLETAVDQLRIVDEALTELLELLDMAVSLPHQSWPSRFEDHYTDGRESVEEVLEDLEATFTKVTTEPPEDAGESYRQASTRVSAAATEMVALLRELFTLITTLIDTSRSTAEASQTATFADLQLVDSELEDSVDEFISSVEDMYDTIEAEVAEMSEKLKLSAGTNFHGNLHDNCPICEQGGSNMQTSTELSIFRCTDCRIEFQRQSMLSVTVVYGNEVIEGVTMAEEMWEALGKDQLEDRAYIKELIENSEKFILMVQISIVALLIFQVGIAIALLGSDTLVFAGGLLLPFPVAYLGLKLLKRIYHP